MAFFVSRNESSDRLLGESWMRLWSSSWLGSRHQLSAQDLLNDFMSQSITHLVSFMNGARTTLANRASSLGKRGCFLPCGTSRLARSR